MLEYRILKETNPDNLNSFMDRVNRFIADGWEPLGGIQVVLAITPFMHKEFYQSMVHESQDAKAMVRRLQAAQKDGGVGTAQWYKDELARAVDVVDSDVEEEN